MREIIEQAALAVRKLLKAFRGMVKRCTQPDHLRTRALKGVANARFKIARGEALQRLKSEGPSMNLVAFSVAGNVGLRGGEAIIADGKPIGLTTSGGYGHTVKRSIALGFVPAGLRASTYAIEVAGKAHPAERSDKPLYDAEGRRVRG